MLSFLPTYWFPQLTDLQPEFLRERGITLLLLDFDNTMLPYTTDEPTPELLDWLNHPENALEELRRFLQTQGYEPNSRRQRVPTFSERYGVPCVLRAVKPRTRGIRTAMRRFSAQKAETALVGDQTYTDVLGANLAGITSLQVRSIHNHTIWLKLRHVLELPCLWMARKRRVEV